VDVNWNSEGHRTCINMELGTFLPVAVPWHGYRGWPMTSCALVVPLGIDVVHQPGLLSGWCGTYVLGKHMFWVCLVVNFQIFIALYFDMRI
jgi:hypothetical protein